MLIRWSFFFHFLYYCLTISRTTLEIIVKPQAAHSNSNFKIFTLRRPEQQLALFGVCSVSQAIRSVVLPLHTKRNTRKLQHETYQ